MSCEKIYNYTTMVFFWRQAFWSWSHSGFNSGINCSKRSSTISISRQSLPLLNPRSVLFSLYHYLRYVRYLFTYRTLSVKISHSRKGKLHEGGDCVICKCQKLCLEHNKCSITLCWMTAIQWRFTQEFSPFSQQQKTNLWFYKSKDYLSTNEKTY